MFTEHKVHCVDVVAKDGPFLAKMPTYSLAAMTLYRLVMAAFYCTAFYFLTSRYFGSHVSIAAVPQRIFNSERSKTAFQPLRQRCLRAPLIQHSFIKNKANNLFKPYAIVKVGKYKGPLAAHFL